ncbi:MAG: hypothetical protein C0626_05005 [Arcobacter sp.]|uniref:TnsA endonuclease N-terminal domain-containing protein n=1 Tax=uncultured Arcobacter sp. TaxID=165434 RepID=UPI000CC9AAA6|nr:TnsA endonuclease N-terminal domain-containing protein [uncultured Arcobacter sp.]PLY10345.1 MAG: hypothetical protein C0626_05005 [Arcobacter sp.]
MPSRKIPKNYRSVTGTFPSYKNKCNVSYESLLERDFYLLLEFNTNVKTYEEQPFTIYYTRNNRTFKYTPDALVHYFDNSLPDVYEIKMSNEIKEKKVFFQEKLNKIEEYVTNNDMNFKVFTELKINSVFLENALFLYRYRDLNNKILPLNILTICKKIDSISVKDLLNELDDNKFKQAEHLPYIWALIFHNKLIVNMQEKITNSSILRINNEED